MLELPEEADVYQKGMFGRNRFDGVIKWYPGVGCPKCIYVSKSNMFVHIVH